MARAHPPSGYRALIQAKGRHGGLSRTAVAQQGEHQRHHVCRRPQPVEGRGFGGREGLATDHAPIALLRLAMHADGKGSGVEIL